MARKVKTSQVLITTLVVLTVYFMCSFSATGWLNLGSYIADFIPVFPGLGFLSGILRVTRFNKLISFILFAYVGFQAWKNKGLNPLDILLLLVGFYVAGGVEALRGSPGMVLGACFWAWANFVQLSPWFGKMAGFRPNWAKDLMPYRVGAYIVEFIVNLLQYPPYGDGRIGDLMSDISYQTVDMARFRPDLLLMMIASIFAVEASFVFITKIVYAIRGETQRPPTRSAAASSREV